MQEGHKGLLRQQFTESAVTNQHKDQIQRNVDLGHSRRAELARPKLEDEVKHYTHFAAFICSAKLSRKTKHTRKVQCSQCGRFSCKSMYADRAKTLYRQTSQKYKRGRLTQIKVKQMFKHVSGAILHAVYLIMMISRFYSTG